MDEKLNTGEIHREKRGFFLWLDNFWYHYKWHSLIALFLVFTVTVCTLQMCQKESYDIQILYAGEHAFSRRSDDADKPEYNKARDTLSQFVKDYDGDGEKNISFRDLFIPKEEQMGSLTESEYRRAYDDRTNLNTLLVSGEYYLLFLSPEIYVDYSAESGRLANLKPFVNEGTPLEYYDDTGTAVYLSSTALYSLSGFSDLPSDTLICVRSANFSSHLNKKKNQKSYEKAVETVTKILNRSASD